MCYLKVNLNCFYKNNNFYKMEIVKRVAINIAIVSVGVLLALKVKEMMNRAKLTPPTK